MLMQLIYFPQPRPQAKITDARTLLTRFCRVPGPALQLVAHEKITRKQEEMHESYLSTLLQMRLLVGFLGERAQFAWWPTAFYEPSSRIFLQPIFSKTSRLAQYHGVLEAARRLHDEHLSVGSYHLFRLPEELEQDLHALLQSTTGEELAAQVSGSKDAAVERLTGLAGASGSSSVGPVAVGNVNRVDSIETLASIAGAYLSAFSHNEKTYPYLVN